MLTQLSVQELALACTQARLNGCQSEGEFSFELFQRALHQCDEEAWGVLQHKYHPMVKSWIYRTVNDITNCDAEDIAQIAYTKFWRNLSRKQVDLYRDFGHVGAVLKYLNQCAVTSAIDYVRQKQRQDRLDKKLFNAAQQMDSLWRIRPSDPCKATLMMRCWLSRKLTDPSERLLLKLMFEYDLKPADIVHYFPQQFPHKDDVRRVRERVLKRARRALVNTAI